MSLSKLSLRTKGVLSLIGSCLIYLVIGSCYIWGSINIYASSYFQGLASDEVSVVFPFTFAITNVGILFSFPLLTLIGFRPTVFLSSFLMFAFFLGSSFCTEFWHFFCCFAIGFGGSSGLLYLTLLYNNYHYFPKKKGLVGGIMMGFFGMAAMVSNSILLALINPENVKAQKDPLTNEYHFPKEIADRFPESLRYLSFYFLGLMIIGSLIQFEYKECKLEESLNNPIYEESETREQSIVAPIYDVNVNSISTDQMQKTENTEVAQNVILDTAAVKTMKKVDFSNESTDFSDSERECPSVLEAFKTPTVYLIMVMMFLSVGNGYFTAMNFKNYGITKISDDSFLTLVGSLSSVCNGGGRFFWGIVSDRLSFKILYILILVIQLFIIATMRFAADMSILYLIWVCMALLCEGGHFVIFPPMTLKVFGAKVGPKVYSLLLMACAASNMVQFGLNLMLRSRIGFENEFYIFLAMTSAALVIIVLTDIRFRK